MRIIVPDRVLSLPETVFNNIILQVNELCASRAAQNNTHCGTCITGTHLIQKYSLFILFILPLIVKHVRGIWYSYILIA